MAKEKVNNPACKPRQGWNRFQTAAFSACVATRFSAFFDPACEPPAQLRVSKQQMEQIPKVTIPAGR